MVSHGTNGSLKLGVLLPTRALVMHSKPPRNIGMIIDMAEAAEREGLDSVWVGDSLTAKPRLEPLSTLVAVSMRTRTIRLGTAVMLGALRHPVLLAHAAATADLISEGRIVLGLGVGGAFTSKQRKEWINAGVDPRHRADRLEAIVSLVKGLTRGEVISHRGRHFDLDDVSIQPVSPQDDGVPILLACHWQAGLERQWQRAGKQGDGFISISDSPEEYGKMSSKVRGYAESAGRDFDAMEAAFYMTVNLRSNPAIAAEEANAFLMRYYGANIWGDRWGPFGPPELTVNRIREYSESGAGTIIVRFASFDQEEQMKIFLRDVVPHF